MKRIKFMQNQSLCELQKELNEFLKEHSEAIITMVHMGQPFCAQVDYAVQDIYKGKKMKKQ